MGTRIFDEAGFSTFFRGVERFVRQRVELLEAALGVVDARADATRQILGAADFQLLEVCQDFMGKFVRSRDRFVFPHRVQYHKFVAANPADEVG